MIFVYNRLRKEKEKRKEKKKGRNLTLTSSMETDMIGVEFLKLYL